MSIITPFYIKYRDILDKEYEQFTLSMETPLRKAIRINTNRISIEKFLKYAESKKWNLEPIPWCPSGFFINRDNKSKALGKDLLHLLGYFYIQEASSMIPPSVLQPQPGDTILDMCSAPGSKTTQVADLINNQGVILANDATISRLKALTYNIETQLALSAVPIHKDGNSYGKNFYEIFDKILVDAPCSSEGTYRKNKEVGIHCTNNTLARKMSNIQSSLIDSAIRSLKVGGVMTYSTCTLTPEENEMIIEYILQNWGYCIDIVTPPDINIKYTPGIDIWDNKKLNPNVNKAMRIWPHLNNSEGFFTAKFIKKDHTKLSTGNTNKPTYSKPQNKILNKHERTDIINKLSDIYGIEHHHFDPYIFYQNKRYIYINPIPVHSFLQEHNLFYKGINICDIDKYNNLHISHLFTQLFGQYAQKNKIILSPEETSKYLIGTDLKGNYGETKYQAIIYSDTSIGHIPISKGLYLASEEKIKNQYPRDKIAMIS